MITNLKKQILYGYKITKQEALKLIDVDLDELCNAANDIRLHFCDNSFDICTIVNGKSGRCSEDCKYCAQSSHYSANIEEYPLSNTKELKREAIYNDEKGILRYSVVTSGRNLSDIELSEICISYKEIKRSCEISLCASHGLLTYDQFVKLKSCGVKRYHNNLESSRKYFKNICTTHSYEDKVEAILNAQKSGLEVCSGGIIGLGETMENRIDMAFELKDLHINSVPINVLNPIKGTPYGDLEVLDYDEVLRVVAIFRFILPNAALRLAGGRGLLSDKGEKVFISGANAAISGDMLTTSGISIKEDMQMLKNLGFEVKRI
jgi:biotin synthase